MQSKSQPSLIANRYHVERLLGEGGMGFVYKANDSLLDITVAIKKLHHYNTHDSIVRFQNEAVALGKLSHNNIARILDFARDGDTLYMVMEYLDGVSLADAIKKEQLPLTEALRIFVEISDAMTHAHKNGVLHRDLKPSNIILVDSEDDKRIPKVVDFGIAKMHSRDQQLTATGVGIGSPFYMSPEQVSSDHVDERSDIYSFGCLMFESLTGDVPLRGDNYLETVQKQIHDQPPRLDEIPDVPQFPESLVALVDKCLAKSPEHRFKRFSEVKEQLLDVMEDEANSRVVEDVSEETLHVPHTPRMPNWAIACVTALILGLVVVFWLGIAELQKPAPETKEMAEKTEAAEAREIKKSWKLGASRPSIIKPSPDGTSLEWKPEDDEHFKALKSHRRLHTMTVAGSDTIDGTGFSYLKKVPLNTLYVNKSSITDDGLRSISTIGSLQSLNLNLLPNITDKGMAYLSSLRDLRGFVITKGGIVTDDGIKVLSQLSKLNTVILDNSEFTDKCLPYLKNHKLTTVGLFENQMTADGIADFVVQHPELENLALNGQNLNDRLIEAISKSSTKDLNLKGAPITNAQVAQLVNSKTIESLWLDAPGMEENGIELLPQCTGLTRLRIFNMTNTTDATIDALTKMRLKLLQVDRSNMSDSQLMRLAKMKTLKEIYIDCPTRLTKANIEKFKLELNRNQKHLAKVNYQSVEEVMSRR